MSIKPLNKFSVSNNLRDPGPMLVYHVSNKEITVNDIKFPGPRGDCDFGSGFYVAQDRDTVEEWVCTRTNPIINVYSLCLMEKDVLHIKGCDWVRVVSHYRRGIGNIFITGNVIRGTIADDRLDDSLSLFLAGEIGDLRLVKCLDHCCFGDQFLFRNSANGLKFEGSYSLTDLNLQMASNRFKQRRRDMNQSLINIRRYSIPGERFIEEYEEGVFYG